MSDEAHISQRDLREIVAGASTLDERLSGPFRPDPAETQQDKVEARLARWCDAVAKGNWALFAQRLAWDGLDLESVRSALGAARLCDEAPLPRWAGTLARGLAAAARVDYLAEVNSITDGARSFLDPGQPIPFEELLAPFVLAARSELAARSGGAYTLLTERAHGAIERHLLRELSHFAAEALLMEFRVLRYQTLSTLERLVADLESSEDRTLYRHFVARMGDGGLTSFMKKYSALARVLATVVDCWVQANSEFLQRLEIDWATLEAVHGGQSPLGEVVAIEAGLSDPHRGRRTVHGLTFASGRRLVYKPKCLGLERTYFGLLAWMNERGSPLPFKVLMVVDRGSHGWVEYVEARPCENVSEVRSYYRRAGMLLCLVYALRGTDFHYENLISSGEDPVLVDLETIVQPRFPPSVPGDGEGALLAGTRRIAESVVYTGLLPYFQIDPKDDRIYDRTGLGGDGETEVDAPLWENVNTDRMTLEYRRLLAKEQPVGPRLGSSHQRVHEYSDFLVEGFEQMYRFLMEHRADLLGAGGPLAALAHQQVRFIFRNSSVYGDLFDHLLRPQHLQHGIDHGIQLELLGRAMILSESGLGAVRGAVLWPLFDAERKAVLQRDIPLFTMPASSDTLETPSGGPVEVAFEPAYSRAVEGLLGLDADDLEEQLSLIQGTLFAHMARQPGPTRSAPQLERRDTLGLTTRTDDLEAAAVAIAEQLQRRAIRAEDGSVTWIGLHYINRFSRYRLQPLAYELYSGSSGVGLFLSAVARVTGDAAIRDLALGTVKPLSYQMENHGDRVLAKAGIGGAAGLGSCVYALVGMSQHLEEPALLGEARRVALFITPDRAAADTSLDVIGGAAGAILGLLALYRRSGGGLDQALACGRRLLEARRRSETGHRAWPTLQGKLLAGFSHGAAGIAYALLCLHEIAPDPAFREAAEEGIAYEDTLFRQEYANWLDLREENGPAFMTSWCHGAPGIGMARLGGLSILDTPQIRADIEAALEATLRIGEADVDHLCCGHLGRTELMLTAGRRLARPELVGAARAHANCIVTRAHQRGGFQLAASLPKRVYSPSFFQGVSGIGYELLRLAHPDIVPSALLWA